MPVQIGAKPESSFQDPIGLLQDCHRRIQTFVSALVQIGASGGSALDQERRRTLETALRYFRESATKHTADEEESLFPRLRAADRDEARGILARVAALEGDHERAATLHAELEELGTRWLKRGALDEDEARRFAAIAQELERNYRSHIAVEETDVFPAASAILEATERQAIGREMAERRGLSVPR
jgi:hemerythrin-like domain-containing protein